MRTMDPVMPIRDLMRSYRDRFDRRARALAVLLDGDDDEVVVRPWELRLPRTVIHAAARSRGLEPVGGTEALVQRGPWLEPMRFRRAAAAAAAADPTRLHPAAHGRADLGPASADAR